ASTGRLASSDPNLQNIPIRTETGRQIRKAFIAGPGNVLISADYSQIELRLAAHMADIHSLREAFHQGLDIHAATASRVFGVPLDQMTPEIRRNAKAINFGILYGMSGHGLARQLGIPVGEANAFVKRYLERYPEMAQYIEQTKAFCREHGYVKTLFGRRCHIPGINDRNGSRRAAFERQAINAPLQGTAADIIKKAMVRLPPALEKTGLKARLILQVHDELVLEAPEAQAEETAAVTRAVMEAAASLSVPLVADSGIGPTWDSAH
nr:DNA polymerase [Pseudomonadota bacterium]